MHRPSGSSGRFNDPRVGLGGQSTRRFPARAGYRLFVDQCAVLRREARLNQLVVIPSSIMLSNGLP